MTQPKSPFCTVVGYDPAILATLPGAQVAQLDSLSQAWLLSSVLLAYPMGIALWLVEHSYVLAVLGAAGTSLLVVNLLRLVIAGSGPAPERPWPLDYHPSLLPPALLLGLALLMSQPAQLLNAPASALEQIRQHRDALERAHQTAHAVIDGMGAVGSGESDVAQAATPQLSTCEFVALRLKLLWQSPTTVVLWTALYLGCAMSPAVLTRVLWLDAVTSYERGRHQTSRRRIAAIVREGRAVAQQQLSAYPSYRAKDVHSLGGAFLGESGRDKSEPKPLGPPPGRSWSSLSPRDSSSKGFS